MGAARIRISHGCKGKVGGKVSHPATETLDVESLIATWVAQLCLKDVPQAARTQAKACIADGLGVMFAGSQVEAFKQCATLQRPAGASAVVDSGAGIDAATAALLNGVACHALDFDDTCYAGIVHGTAVVLPAVLAVSQQLNVTGEKLLEGFIAGVECMYALGLALTDSLYKRGFWSTGTLGVIGAAAGAAKVMNLDADGIANAIRIAANVSIGLRVTHGSSGKPYLCGLAAKLGVEAAQAAAIGIQGNPGTLEGPRGFASTLNGGLLRRELIEALGTRYSLMDPGIAFKLRPLCSAAQAAIEATIALQSEHKFNSGEVLAISCSGPPLVTSSLPYKLTIKPSEAQFSMSFAVACTLLHGDVLLEHLASDVLADERLCNLMERVDLVEDAIRFPPSSAAAGPEASRVEIVLRDGRTFEKTVMAATGMPQRPATTQQLQMKFMNCAMRVLGALEAGELWNRVHRIEALERVRLLFQALLPNGRA